MSIEIDFKKAVEDVKALAKRPSDSDLLLLYALFKQSENGDCEGSRPGIFDIVGRKKFDAWKALSGTSRDQAMEKYISLVTQLKAK